MSLAMALPQHLGYTTHKHHSNEKRRPWRGALERNFNCNSAQSWIKRSFELLLGVGRCKSRWNAQANAEGREFSVYVDIYMVKMRGCPLANHEIYLLEARTKTAPSRRASCGKRDESVCVNRNLRALAHLEYLRCAIGGVRLVEFKRDGKEVNKYANRRSLKSSNTRTHTQRTSQTQATSLNQQFAIKLI